MKKKHTGNNFDRGFSLLELMIAMSIFSILTVTSITIYLKAVDQQRDIRYMGLIAEEVNNIFNRISKDIRSAISIEENIEDQSRLEIEKRDPETSESYFVTYYAYDGGLAYEDTRDPVPEDPKITLLDFEAQNVKFNIGNLDSNKAPYVILTYTAYYLDKNGQPIEATRVDISSTMSMRSVIRSK